MIKRKTMVDKIFKFVNTMRTDLLSLQYKLPQDALKQIKSLVQRNTGYSHYILPHLEYQCINN